MTAKPGYPIVTIGGTDLSIIEYRGQRVVTLAQIDAVHHRPKGTARRNLSTNRSRLIAGEDFVEITADEIRAQSLRAFFPARTPKGVLVTESGYLMLAKSFTDDLAWQVQRKLVANYFRHRQPEPEPALPYKVGKGDTLTKAEQDKLRDTIYAARDQLPHDQQGEFTTKAWSKLKSHFHYRPGENYRHIPRAQFGEAMALIERHIAEFEPRKGNQPLAIGHERQGAVAALVAVTGALAQALPTLLAVVHDGSGMQVLTAAPDRSGAQPGNAPAPARPAQQRRPRNGG